jgi:hypothetical protein
MRMSYIWSCNCRILTLLCSSIVCFSPCTVASTTFYGGVLLLHQRCCPLLQPTVLLASLSGGNEGGECHMTVRGWLEWLRMCKFRALLVLQRFGTVSLTGIRNVGCPTPNFPSGTPNCFKLSSPDRQWRKRRAADGVF